VIDKLDPILIAISREAVDVGRALGHDELDDPVTLVEGNKRFYQAGKAGAHKASMLLDVEQGKPFEVEVILGEVVRDGKRRGVPVPLLEACYAMLYATQQQFIASTKY